MTFRISFRSAIEGVMPVISCWTSMAPIPSRYRSVLCGPKKFPFLRGSRRFDRWIGEREPGKRLCGLGGIDVQ
ncbi:hypothetical protein [Halalkalicoccus tibetensis]|uniref:Uncharacterized protein n=1 Tax=Halalkalicoccus tibetensis TaxID=175632 RepID=A0ABD5V708_9EURY